MDSQTGSEEPGRFVKGSFPQEGPAVRPRRRILLSAVIMRLGIAGFVVAGTGCRRETTRPKTPSRQEQAERQEKPRPQGEEKPPDASGRPLTQVPRPTASSLKQEAFDAVTRLVDDFPDSCEAMGVSALAHARFGKSAEAVRCWEKSLQLNPRFAEAYHGLGSIAMQKGEYEEAVELLRKALQINPRLPGAHTPLAESLMSLGKLEEAAAVLEEHLETSAGTAESFFWLGQAYLQLNDYEKAKQYHQAAIERDPDCTYSYYGLSTACARLGDREASRQSMEKFRALKARDQQAERERLKALDDAAEVARGAAFIHWAIGKVYANKNELRKAEEQWLKAAALAPDGTACREELVSLYEHQNRISEAIQISEQLSAIQPENVLYLLKMGMLNGRLQRFDAAEEAFQRVRQRSPRRAVGYVALAQLYLSTNRKLAEARALAHKAVELEPNAPNYSVLSAACESGGDRAGAVAAMERAIELDPENATYREVYESIRGKD